MEQLGLAFAERKRGGARPRAGRKPLPAGQRHTPHRARPKHKAAHPVHVTLRASARFLRSQHVVRTVLGALRDSRREGCRIIHYSIQHNHIHLILEAESAALLSSGVCGIMVRITKRVNKLLFRTGSLWSDRWHGHALETPREVRNTLRYVLQNHRKHRSANTALDPLSSAQWFNGFATPLPVGFRSVGPPCIAEPQTWLLRVGWERHGRIGISEGPTLGEPRRRPKEA